MHSVDLELYGTSATFQMSWFGDEQEKKETNGNDYLILVGALAVICENNEELLEEYGLTMQQVVADATMQDSELYLNGFEGYELSERLNLRTLFLNKYGCVVASVYDKKFDRYLDFVM